MRMRVNWNNSFENIIFLITGVAIGVGSCVVAYKTMEPMIIESIKKETHRIENSFDMKIKNLKSKKGGTIDLSVTPEIDNTIQQDSVKEKTKRGLFKRIFKKD